MDSSSKIAVAFLSSSYEPAAKRFFQRIMKDENSPLKCSFLKLKPEDLESIHCGRNYDAFVLLHSVSQGRNSVTDVADARYDKLLLQLEEKYGSKRVAVVVHSISSYNTNTRSILMMTFKENQPSTFRYSACVIQCNNLCDMPDDDLSRLIRFLQDARDQPRPKEDDEPRGIVEGSSGLAELSDGISRQIRNQLGYLTATYNTNDEAVGVLCGTSRKYDLLRNLLPFPRLEHLDNKGLEDTGHNFKAVLFDVGEMKNGIYPSQDVITFVNTFKEKSGSGGHVALLMSIGDPADEDKIRRFCKHLEQPMFLYTCGISGNLSFCGNAEEELEAWLLKCNKKSSLFWQGIQRLNGAMLWGRAWMGDNIWWILRETSNMLNE